MRDVLDDLVGWWQAGQTVGMGTVVATWRSAPRPAGASMLVGPDGTAVGSVSGGCVEGAVYEEAKDAVETGEVTLQRYGVSDDDAFAVGLTCGGILDVFVESVSRESFPELGEVKESVDAVSKVQREAEAVGVPVVVEAGGMAARAEEVGAAPAARVARVAGAAPAERPVAARAAPPAAVAKAVPRAPEGAVAAREYRPITVRSIRLGPSFRNFPITCPRRNSSCINSLRVPAVS